MDRERILDILNSGEFEGLIGVYEDEEIDFKSSPYRLREDYAAFELGKDVGSFANLQGGLTLVGFETETAPDSPWERVKAVRPFDRGLVDGRQHLDVIRDRVFPAVRGLRIEFKESATEPGRGVLLIDTPRQDESEKYFLVRRPFVAGRTRGLMVVIPIRMGTDTRALSIEEIHGLIKSGRNVGNPLAEMNTRLARLEERGATPPEQVPADLIDARIKRTLDDIAASASIGA